MSEPEPEAIDTGQAIRETLARWMSALGPFAGSILKADEDDAETLHARVADGTLQLLRGDHNERLVEAALAEKDSPRRLQDVLAGIPGPHDVDLLFSDANVLRPSLTLPRASRKNLRQALHFELERLSPVPPEEVFFDFTIARRDPDAGTLDLALRIIRRETVTQAIDLCHASGLSVKAIWLGTDDHPADWQTFPIDHGAKVRSSIKQFAVALLAATALVLLIAVLAASYLRGADTTDSLADELSSKGIRAARVERLQHRIDRAAAQLAFLGKQKHAPLFVGVLNDITHALPDDTWITNLGLSGNKIRIEGYSQAASDLIRIFDRSGRFANAQFAAPVTQAATPGLEHFDLTLDVQGDTR